MCVHGKGCHESCMQSFQRFGLARSIQAARLSHGNNCTCIKPGVMQQPLAHLRLASWSGTCKALKRKPGRDETETLSSKRTELSTLLSYTACLRCSYIHSCHAHGCSSKKCCVALRSATLGVTSLSVIGDLLMGSNLPTRVRCSNRADRS